MKQVPENAVEIIKNIGASSLPDSPTQQGYTAAQVKRILNEAAVMLAQWILSLKGNVDDIDAFLDEIEGKYVHLTGNETIAGTKTFSNGVNFDGAVTFNGTIVNGQTGYNVTLPEGGTLATQTYVFTQLVTERGKFLDGTYMVYKAYCDSNGNPISATYETKATGNALQSAISKILDGTSTVAKTLKDGSGNTITSTYETKADAQAKVAVANLRTILGLASTTEQGLMSATDKARLDALHALLGESADSDTVVNTINEVLAIFAQYPEGVNLANALASKVAFSDVINNTESNEISKPLSAYMGKVLNGRLAEVEENYVDHDDVFAAAMFTVSDYNQSTGEITLEYSSSAITNISYNSSTGEVVFTY